MPVSPFSLSPLVRSIHGRVLSSEGSGFSKAEIASWEVVALEHVRWLCVILFLLVETG